MNYDKRSSSLMFKEEGLAGEIEENFEIDDDINMRMKETSNLPYKPSKVSTHLEPLKLDRTRFYNYVKRSEN